LAVDFVLTPFADAVATARHRRRIAAIHWAVAGLLARSGTDTVPTASLTSVPGTSTVDWATETVLVSSAAHPVSARAAAIKVAFIRHAVVVAVLAEAKSDSTHISDAILITIVLVGVGMVGAVIAIVRNAISIAV